MERASVSKKKISAKAAVGKSGVSGSSTVGKKRKDLSLSTGGDPVLETKAKEKKSVAPTKANDTGERKSSVVLKQEIETLKVEIEVLKNRENNLKKELENKAKVNNTSVSANLLKEFADISEDIHRLKTDVLDLSNNVFHLHKVVKDSRYAIEHKVSRLFVRIAIVVVSISVGISLFSLWWASNPTSDVI